MVSEAQDRVYEVLVEHQVRGTDGWDLRKVMADLHDWAEVFRLRFKLEVPPVPLRLARLRLNCLGHFRPGHNDFGLRNEIAVDTNHLVSCLRADEWWQVLATLLHEQLHFWQQLRGSPPKPGPGNYHNAQYQAKAEGLGLLVSNRGVHQGYDTDGPFWTLLQERGVRVPGIPPRGRRDREKKGSKLKKWSCECVPPVNVRVAIAPFLAVCLHCNARFQLSGR